MCEFLKGVIYCYWLNNSDYLCGLKMRYDIINMVITIKRHFRKGIILLW